MLYIALAITSLLTLFYGISYNEQLHKTSVYRSKVDWLLCDNKILKEKLDKRNAKKIAAGVAVFAAGTALTFMAIRSVPEIEAPEELEHDDLDEADDVESDDSED